MKQNIIYIGPVVDDGRWIIDCYGKVTIEDNKARCGSYCDQDDENHQ